MTNIRLPNITAATEREQLLQVKSYLHQLVQELNWALSTIESGNSPKAEVAGISSAVTKQELSTSFNSLKALIIKSSDTVMAYSEAAEERYKSLYVAQSDFGTYKEEAEQRIVENSSSIEQFFTNMQEIISHIDVLEHSLDVSGNIKSGVLYYDDSGIPVYGVEVGQRTEIDGVEVFDKFARFTSDRLSFYDQNDNEVAYISDMKLFITHAEVKIFSMGGFRDTTLSDGSIVTKWVGTGG
jgi:hypothetical protein